MALFDTVRVSLQVLLQLQRWPPPDQVRELPVLDVVVFFLKLALDDLFEVMILAAFPDDELDLGFDHFFVEFVDILGRVFLCADLVLAVAVVGVLILLIMLRSIRPIR